MGILFTELRSPPFCAVRSLSVRGLYPFIHAHLSPRSYFADIEILVYTVFFFFLSYLSIPSLPSKLTYAKSHFLRALLSVCPSGKQ